MAKKYFWLKLKDDFFRQKEIKKLRRIAGGDTYTIIYLKLQLLSVKTEGKLIFEGIEDTFAEEIALELDEDVENVKITLMFLQKHGLIVEFETDEFILPETVKSIGKESDSAERMRKCREKKKQQQLASNTKTSHSDIEVTACYTEIEIEKEIEKEIDSSSRETIEEEDEIKSIMSFCQKHSFKLRKCDAAVYINSFGYDLVNKGLAIAVNAESFVNGNVRSYKAYLGKILSDLTTVKAPVAQQQTRGKKKNLAFLNYKQRDQDENYYEGLEGWDHE